MMVDKLKIEDIRVRARLRDVDKDNPEYKALVQNVRDHGLSVRIELVKLGKSPPHLVHGAHRLAALKESGVTELIEGRHFNWLDTAGLSPREIVCKAQFSEVNENVHRVGLSPRQYAKFVNRAGQIVAREELARRRAKLVEERRKTEEAAEAARKAREEAREAGARLAKAREAEKAAQEAADEKARKRAEDAAKRASEALRKRNEAAAAAEKERNRQRMATERLQQSLTFNASTVLSRRDDNTVQTTRPKAANGYVETLARRLDLSPRHVKNVRSRNMALLAFIRDEDLEAHPICERIDRTTGEFTALLEMAKDHNSFYHKGLKQWCDDVRARKNVLMPSALKQKIKEQEAEARRAELRQNEKAAFRTAVSDFRGIVSTFKAFKAKVVGNHSKSPHARVQELARREMQVIDRIMQALEDMNTRIDGVVAAHKSDDGNA